MEGLIKVQKDLKITIEKGLSNFKKSPRDRLSLEYIETRLEGLEKHWTSFFENNAKLYAISEPGKLEQSDYFTKEMYDQTEEVYFTYKSQMKAMLNKYLDTCKQTEQQGVPIVPHNQLSCLKFPFLYFPGNIQNGQHSAICSLH